MTAPVTRVLVVDDEPESGSCSACSRRVGYQVVGESPDGASAVERCRADRPDAVILDLLMPGMTGFEAIPLIRGIGEELGHDMTIVAYTAVAGDFVRQAMALA